MAVGSHDNNIYTYNVENTYALMGRLRAHTSFITSLDWSEDSSSI